MSVKRHVNKATGLVGILTLVSRVLGFVRDVMMAWFFGAGFFSDAFFAAFRIFDFFRRLFVEGTLSSPLVSVFTGFLVKDRQKAFEFAGGAFRFFSVFLVLAVLAGMIASPAIVSVTVPGYVDDPQRMSLTVMLMRIMFPYLFCIGLLAVCMGFLNVLGHFAAPALAPVLLNLSMIGAMLWISPFMDTPVTGLALGVALGGVLQLALQVPFLVKKGILPFRGSVFYHPGIRKAAFLMPPMFFGAAVFQMNVFIGTFLASFLPVGSLSHLYYADRLVQFPVGIFAVAASTAALPVLTRQAVSGDRAAVCDTLSYALKMVFFISLPAMAGLIVLRRPLVMMLFQRGVFDAASTVSTADALMYYGLGIWAFSGVRILVAAYFAVSETATPVRTAALAVAANIVFGAAFLAPMGTGGVALAVSAASMVHFGLLVCKIRERIGPVDFSSIAVSVGRTAFCTGIMAVVVKWISAGMISCAAAPDTRLAWGLSVCILSGIAVYGACSLACGHPELKMMMRKH